MQAQSYFGQQRQLGSMCRRPLANKSQLPGRRKTDYGPAGCHVLLAC